MKGALLGCCLVFLAPGLRGQPLDTEDSSLCLGFTLAELLGRFGVPERVYAARGLEPWQDDVVFVYGDREFYIYRDRVWQLALKSAYGVTVGDNWAALSFIFGEDVEIYEGYTLRALAGWPWPVMFRANVNPVGAVSALYIYRSDY